METCIIGLGNIGSAIYNGMKTENVTHQNIITTCDMKEYHSGIWQSMVMEADVNIICLPVYNDDDDQNMSVINHYLEYLYLNKPKNGIVIICSTVLPQSIEQKYYDDLNIVFWPQFMNERNAIQEFKETEYIVLGSNSIKTTKKAKRYIESQFEFNKQVKYELTSIKYASLYKYLRNLKMSYNVLFWNYVFNMSVDKGFDHRKISDMMKNNPVAEYDNVAADGFYGIGGTCLPKDLDAIHNYYQHDLTEMLQKFNSRIRN